MTHSLPPDSDLWSPSLARRLDAVCNRFEAAWVSSQRPRLEDYVGDTPPPERAELLRELLALELTYRARSGEAPTAPEYCRRFPDHAGLIQTVFQELAPLPGDSHVPTRAEGPGGPAAEPRTTLSCMTAVGPGGVQDRTPMPGQLTATLSQPQAARPSAAGPSIPGYEVLGLLGRGGMGVVYRAHHVPLKRLVRETILAGNEAEPQQRERFRAEAEAAARLQHANIVQIYEVGEYDGQPYLALEYVEGGSLEQRLDSTPLPPDQAARLLEPVARAIHYAHARGIVHRDLKPANILLRGKSEIRNPKSEFSDSEGSDFGFRIWNRR